MKSPIPKKGRYPVSSFAPEVMAALIKGSTEKVVLRFRQDGARSAMSQAIFMQHRIHTLRSMMRLENHEHAELVSRARTSKVWGIRAGEEHGPDHKGEKYCELQIYPQDSQFSSVFKEAGVEVKSAEVTLTPDQEEALAPLVGPDPYADFKSPTSEEDK